MTNKPLALSLDLDDTLSDSDGILDAVRHTCRVVSRATDLDVDEIFHANLASFRSYFPLVEVKWAMGEMSDREVRTEVWSRTFSALGVSEEELVDDAVVTFSAALRSCLRLHDDVPAFLSSVREFPLALLTNGAAAPQREKIETLGLSDQFEVVVVGGEVGHLKPAPEAFELVAEGLGVRLSDIWHLGDSLSTDVAGANGAGCVSVWLNRDGRIRDSEDPRPHHTIRSLAEFGSLKA